MKTHVRYAMRHLFSLCLFLLVCLTAHAVELERYSLEEWQASSRKRVLAGRVTDFRREFEEWLGSKARVEPAGLVALLDHPVVAMAAAQAELATAFPLELGKASRSAAGGREFLADVFSDPAWLDSFVLSGRLPAKTGDGFTVAAKLWQEDVKLHDDPLWHRVLAALVLESVPLDAMKIGTEVRFRFLKQAHDGGKLFERFNTLNAWELRFVIGSSMPHTDMTWVHQKADELKLNRQDAGQAARAFGMVPYRMKNQRGVSVQSAGFYDGKPVTLQLLTEYGAVCGGISRFGANFSIACGIPAFTMGQAPDHCAFCWKPGADWGIGNDVHGWGSSQIGAVFDGWGGEGAQILLADALISKSKTFSLSHRILQLNKLRNRAQEANAFARLAIAREPLDFNAWLILARQYSKGGMQVAQKDPALALLIGAVNAFKAHPAMLGIWFGEAGTGIVGEIDKLPETRERGGTYAIAQALATQCPGANIMPTLQSLVRLRLREMKQEARFEAFRKGDPAAFYAGMEKRYEWKAKKMFKDLEDGTSDNPVVSGVFLKFSGPVPKKPSEREVRREMKQREKELSKKKP